MKRKKWLALFLTGCIVVGSLAGCGSSSDDGKKMENSADTASSAQGEQAREEKNAAS